MPVKRGHVAPQNTYIDTIIKKFDAQSKVFFFFVMLEVVYILVNVFEFLLLKRAQVFDRQRPMPQHADYLLQRCILSAVHASAARAGAKVVHMRVFIRPHDVDRVKVPDQPGAHTHRRNSNHYLALQKRR